MMEVLERMGPEACAKLSMVSRALYCFTYHDSLWREFTIGAFKGKFDFHGGWRNTYKYTRSTEPGAKPFVKDVSIPVEGLYSDLLYTNWRCLSVPLSDLCNANGRETIDRRSNLTMEQFITEYAIPNKPVIITDVVEHWPAYKKWTFDHFNSSENKETTYTPCTHTLGTGRRQWT
jgi:hypothetical protein